MRELYHYMKKNNKEEQKFTRARHPYRLGQIVTKIYYSNPLRIYHRTIFKGYRDPLRFCLMT